MCVCVYSLPCTTRNPWDVPGRSAIPGAPFPQGSEQEGTMPGADTWWVSVCCHAAHWPGSTWEGRGAGTKHRQLVKLARGTHSILSHATVAFRQGVFLAGASGPASVFVSGGPRFPELQMSLEFSRPSFSNVLPWLIMEGRTDGSTRLLCYRALIEGQSQQNFTANCRLCTPYPPLLPKKLAVDMSSVWPQWEHRISKLTWSGAYKVRQPTEQCGKL